MQKKIREMPHIDPPKDLLDLTVGQFASMFHTAALGVGCSEAMVRFKTQMVMDSGYRFKAFNIESPYLGLARNILGDSHVLLVPISYPIGGQTIEKRLLDIGYAADHDADQCCVSLNYAAALSRDYETIRRETERMHSRFDEDIHIIDIIPATLFTAKELISTCKALHDGGSRHLKVNPGYGLGTTFEEVSLIKRVFGDQFVVDPSGDIRQMKDVREYVRRGFTVIHSQKTFSFIEEFKQMKEKGGDLYE